ncbi:MAG TPA: ferrous iron transport protein A [Proteobacteria bacterium]|nr:ferrous iron transport protein A [Pseudomonadota bacterium]
MVLPAASCGKSLRLLHIDAGQGVRSRLAAMGMVPGVEVKVLVNEGRGPLIVTLDGNRIMLGRGMAEKIMVG